MEKDHQPEKSSSFNKKDEDNNNNNNSAADNTLPLPETDSPKCFNEEKPTAAEITTEAEMEKITEERKSCAGNTETDQASIEKLEEKEKEEEKQTEEDSDPPPEIKYTLETAFEDVECFLSNFSTSENEEEDETGLEIPEFTEKYLDLVEEKISKHEETKGKGCQISDPDQEDPSFLKTVDQISKLCKNLSAVFKLDSKQGFLINRIGKVQQRFMSCLEDEFRSLLGETVTREPEHKQEVADQCPVSNQDEPVESSNEESNFPGYYCQQVLSNLNNIARIMISGGFESECCEVYMVCRRNIIEETFNKIGFEKISIDEIQKMHWEALEREIPPWIKTFKECANVYFPGERKLAETIFSDYPSLSDSLFSNLTRGVFIQLLNFAEAVAISKRSSEKLFKFLDMYETLRDNMSPIDNVFPEECARELKTETTTARSRIGEAAICFFCDFENSIKSDTGKTPVPGGAVHPLTRYTMNYLKYACDEYKDTLEQVFKDHTKIERADSTSRPRDYESDSQNYNEDEENQSPFSSQLMRIMDLLDSILEAKSKLYKDIALSCIFMMNNGRYMLQKVKGSALFHEVMGDTWRRKRSSDLRNYHQTYKRETWMKLLGSLNQEGLNVNGKVSKPVLKERFKSFNYMFDEIHKTQSSWIVSDKQLQSELRVSISGVIIPAYRSFLGRFSGYLDPGRQTEKYIKFQPEDIETYIDELFEGNPASMARRRT